MNNTYFERAKKVIPDPKILSIVVSKRAKQLALGARPMVRCNLDNHLDIALLEVSEGLVDFEQAPVEVEGAEAVEAAEEKKEL